MKAICDKGLELKGSGKPVWQFHEESRLNDSKLSRVPNLEAEIDRHGLMWLSQRLAKYTPYLIREFYAIYAATIFQRSSQKEESHGSTEVARSFVSGSAD